MSTEHGSKGMGHGLLFASQPQGLLPEVVAHVEPGLPEIVQERTHGGDQPRTPGLNDEAHGADHLKAESPCNGPSAAVV